MTITKECKPAKCTGSLLEGRATAAKWTGLDMTKQRLAQSGRRLAGPDADEYGLD